MYFEQNGSCDQKSVHFLKSIMGSPVKRHHRPGTILYQNDRYYVLRSPDDFENCLSSDGEDFCEFRHLGIKAKLF